MLLIAALLLVSLTPTAPARAAALQRWAYYVKTDPQSLTTLELAAKQFAVVLPYYFDVEESGEIVGSDEPGVTRLIRSAGAKVIPMIQNRARYDALSPLLQEAPRRASLQDRIVDLVKRNSYDGIQIDFEWINEEDRAAYSAFMAELAAKLKPAGKHLSVAVPDKPMEGYSKWSAAYDYGALGKAADTVVLMTYGFRSIYSAPGAYAPAGWVSKVVQFAKTQIPSSKLLMGIGLWGYDWDASSPDQAGSARRTRDILRAGRQIGAEFGFDEVEQSAWSRYKDPDGNQHVVWFEDKRSVDAKTRIAEANSLLGIAMWRLGQEDPAVLGLPPEAPTVAASAARSSTDGFSMAAGRFFAETGGGNGRGFLVYDGSPNVADKPVRFWSEFQRLGGLDVLGYPISQRYTGSDGLVYQAFQRAVLQWRPELDRALFANTFNLLQAAGKDDWLEKVKGIPRSKEDETGGNWDRARAVRFGWLTNEAIARWYVSNPNPSVIKEWSDWEAIQLYGLPMSEPQRFGPFTSQRFQRVTLQLWVEDVPGMPAKGSVVPVLGGDIFKEAGLIPASAVQPIASP